MDWSKKIGIAVVLVLVLTACSSRKSYGSVYFSRGDINDSTSLSTELSARDYMLFSSDEYEYLRSTGSNETNALDSLVNQADLNSEINALDTSSLMKSVFKDTVIRKSILLKQESNDRNDSIDSIEVVKADVLIDVVSDSLVVRLDYLNSLKTDSDTVVAIDSIRDVQSDPNEDIPIEKDKIYSDTNKRVSLTNDNPFVEKDETDTLTKPKDSISSMRSVDIDSSKTVTKEVQVLERMELRTNIITKGDSIDSIDVNDHIIAPELDTTSFEESKLNSESEELASETYTYSIFFDSGHNLLSEESKKTLLKLIDEADQKEYILKLTGHADKSGSEVGNKMLSEARVKSVLNYLVAQGMDERNIYLQSFGDKYVAEDGDLNPRIVLCRLIISK